MFRYHLKPFPPKQNRRLLYVTRKYLKADGDDLQYYKRKKALSTAEGHSAKEMKGDRNRKGEVFETSQTFTSGEFYALDECDSWLIFGVVFQYIERERTNLKSTSLPTSVQICTQPLKMYQSTCRQYQFLTTFC